MSGQVNAKMLLLRRSLQQELLPNRHRSAPCPLHDKTREPVFFPALKRVKVKWEGLAAVTVDLDESQSE